MDKLGYVVAAIIVLFAGTAWGEAGEPEVVTRVDTVTSERYAGLVDELRLENNGLRARIEGIESRPPRVIVRTDTLVSPPDTVIRFLSVGSEGNLTLDFLTARDSLYAPELHRDIDVSDCDEGWTVQDGEVLCDRARLGHLYVGPWLSLEPALAMWWEPSYRSPWEAFVRYSGSWDFGIRRGVQIW